MTYIPLNSAFLCCDTDCNVIGNDSRTCPACAGGSLLALSRVMARNPIVRYPCGPVAGCGRVGASLERTIKGAMFCAPALDSALSPFT
jgi:ribosomal protein S27AE